MEAFVLDVDEIELQDLRNRLARTRFPEAEPVGDWSQGVPLAHAVMLRDYWMHVYDWRKTEATLNAFGQWLAMVDGAAIHFLHVRSPVANARPLLLTHGWPGSVVEFLDIIEPLTDPEGFGGERGDAFHVVVPSLPGYGFSSRPRQPGWSVERIADAWVTLMARLGYEDWIAQGGDWGALVSTAIGVRHPRAVAGIHLNMPFALPDSDTLTEEEERAMSRYREHLRWGTGYFRQQSTRPQTLGYALADSPMGQAAWIVEKFHAWTDHDGDYETVIDRDRLLDNVMLYWLNNSGAASARLYWDNFRRPNLDPVHVPTGCSVFPREIVPAIRRFVEQRYRDVHIYREHARGGHFAALEQPVALVEDIRAFSASL